MAGQTGLEPATYGVTEDSCDMRFSINNNLQNEYFKN